MKINLNLLPAKQKKRLFKIKIAKIIIWQELLFLLFILILCLFFLGFNYVVDIKLKVQEDILSKKSNQKEFQEIKQYREKFSKINQKIKQIKLILDNNYYWEKPLIKILDLVSSNDNININEIGTKNNIIDLKGIAVSRESLVNFKNKLENDNCFDKINVPIENLMSKKDINFHIEIKVNQNCFKLE